MNTGVGSLSLLQGIFPIQESNQGLLHCGWILYGLRHQESPWILEWVAYSFSRSFSWPKNRTGISCIAGGFLTSWPTREALIVTWPGIKPMPPAVEAWSLFFFIWAQIKCRNLHSYIKFCSKIFSSLLRTDQPFIQAHPQPTLTYPPISPLIIQSPIHTHTRTHPFIPLILNYSFASQNYRDHASDTLGGLLMLRFGYFHHWLLTSYSRQGAQAVFGFVSQSPRCGACGSIVLKRTLSLGGVSSQQWSLRHPHRRAGSAPLDCFLCSALGPSEPGPRRENLSFVQESPFFLKRWLQEIASRRG